MWQKELFLTPFTFILNRVNFLQLVNLIFNFDGSCESQLLAIAYEIYTLLMPIKLSKHVEYFWTCQRPMQASVYEKKGHTTIACLVTKFRGY